MKKFILSLVAALMMAAGANAQVYVGGGFGIGGEKQNDNDAVTTYKFIPEIGYNFNDKWAAGVTFGWEGANKGGDKYVGVAPYARWTYAHSKYVNGFVEGGFGYKHAYSGAGDKDYWQVGLRPGVMVNLNKKLSFVTRVGFLGWKQAKDNDNDGKVSKYGLDLDGNNITFSLYYNF